MKEWVESKGLMSIEIISIGTPRNRISQKLRAYLKVRSLTGIKSYTNGRRLLKSLKQGFGLLLA